MTYRSKPRELVASSAIDRFNTSHSAVANSVVLIDWAENVHLERSSTFVV